MKLNILKGYRAIYGGQADLTFCFYIKKLYISYKVYFLSTRIFVNLNALFIGFLFQSYIDLIAELAYAFNITQQLGRFLLNF